MKRLLVISFALVGLLVDSQLHADETPLPVGARARLGSLRLRHEGSIGAICFAPDGKTIASAGGSIRIWNAADGKLLREIGNSDIFTVAFSPDGRTIAAGLGPDVFFWDPQSGREIRHLTGKGNRIVKLTFASDGNVLVCGDADHYLYRWDLKTGKCSHCRNFFDGNPLRVFGNGHVDKKVHLASLAADGKTAVWFVRHWREDPVGAVSGAGHLVIWDWPEGKALCNIEINNPNDPFVVALSPNGKFLTYASNGYEAVTIWDASTGKAVKTLDTGSRIETIAFSADGRRVAAILDCHGLVVWDIATGKECLRQSFHAWYSSFGPLVFSPDGKKVAIGQAHSMRIWDVSSGKETPLLEGHRQAVVSLAVSAKDGTLISGDGQHRCTWDRQFRQAQRQAVLARSAQETSKVVSYPLNLRVIHPKDGPLQLRTLDTDKLVCEIPDGKGTYWGGAFSGDGRTLALRSGANWAELTIFDIPARRIRSIVPIENGNVLAFVLTPDGRSLAIGWADQTVKVIDTFTGKVTHILGEPKDPRPEDRLGLGVFSVDGQWVAFANDLAWVDHLRRAYGIRSEKNPRIRVWHVPSGRELRQFETCLSQATGGTVVGLSFSLDNRNLAVALQFDWEHRDNPTRSAVRVLEVSSGRLRHLFDGHVGDVCSVAFFPNGKTLATGGEDSTILLWDLERSASKLAAKEAPVDRLNGQWKQLADLDARCAHDAAMAFAARPDEALPFLAEQLQPVDRPSDEQLAKWIAELDHDAFQVREAATRKLGALERYARPALTRTLQANVSAEARRRIQELLDCLATPESSAEWLRELRAIEVLERIGSADARKVLKRLAGGVPGANRTVEANSALVRLAAAGKCGP